MDQSTHVALRKTPWNKGKLVGQKAPLKLKDIWAIRVRLQIGRRTRELALFNLATTASCDRVIGEVTHERRLSWKCRRRTHDSHAGRRPNARCSLKSPNRLATLWPHGFVPQAYILRTTCFQAASMHRHICPRANMRASYGVGFGKLGSMPAPMARTPCGGRRLH
jgi:hypothetical protein